MNRTCKKCGRSLPETEEYFYRHPYVRMDGTSGYRAICKDCCAKYYDDHREVYVHREHMYRAERKGHYCDLSLNDWEDIKEEFEHRCAYCGRQYLNFFQDHIVPRSQNGAYTKANIVPACQRCNVSKSDHPFTEWYKKQPFYSPEREAKILNRIKEVSV